MAKMDGKGVAIGEFVNAMKHGYDRCLDPAMHCDKPAIKAHSVQNAQAMDLIVEDGHVSSLGMKLKNGEPDVTFRRIGRNEASTFTGLCSAHDTSIFLPVDTRPLSLTDQEQLFLLAYRSITREFHTVMQGAIRVQTLYSKGVEEGVFSGTEFSPAGMKATIQLMRAWATWKYRFKFFDQPLVKNNLTSISHSTFVIDDVKAVIAASSYFSVQDGRPGNVLPAVILNVVPLAEEKTAVIFSYAREHSSKARKYLAPIMLEQDAARKRLMLSHLIVNRAENFFVTPSVVAAWTPEKRAFIEQAFVSNLFVSRDLAVDERLYLFAD